MLAAIDELIALWARTWDRQAVADTGPDGAGFRATAAATAEPDADDAQILALARTAGGRRRLGCSSKATPEGEASAAAPADGKALRSHSFWNSKLQPIHYRWFESKIGFSYARFWISWSDPVLFFATRDSAGIATFWCPATRATQQPPPFTPPLRQPSGPRRLCRRWQRRQ